MGILDDAIREHLELKRAHGASDDEVRVKETEVFGPVRQDVGPQMPAAAEDQTTRMPTAAEPLAPAPEAAAPAPPAESVVEPPEPAADDPYAVHPGDVAVPDPHHEGEPGGSDPAWGEDTGLFSEPEPPRQQEQREERHPALHDTDEHLHGGSQPPDPVFSAGAERSPAAPEAPIAPPQPVEEPVEAPPVEEPPVEAPEPSGEPEADAEDVLEETPEFLQDAPEHDRLWFEQKPPRDFDFGE